MKFFVLYAILAVIIGSSTSFRLDSLEENIEEDRIVGGKTAKPGQFPYQVSLRLKKSMYHVCGGSIISDRWIVSAANCTQGESSKPSNLVVVFGSYHIQNNGQIYSLDRIVNYPTFNESTYAGDITLLRTNKTIEFNKVVRPIPLRRGFVGAAVAATASGWGLLQYPRPTERPTYLQLLDVKTLTNQFCWTLANETVRAFINNGTLCAFTRYGQGMCYGDSGSPLASSGQLIGVVSWVALPCARGQPDAFTRISTFLEWIRKVSGVVAV